MNSLKIKCILTMFLNIIGYTNYKLNMLNKKYNNNYIRVLNYHEVFYKNISNFESQIKWLSSYFVNVNKSLFEDFMLGKHIFRDKPGVMITFDDGFVGNYFNAYKILDKYKMTGYFFVSSSLVGKDGYMSAEQLKELLNHNHVIGCHTNTHHRMNENDSKSILNFEIVQSRKILEVMLNTNIDTFCWVGGEEDTYTKLAAQTIKNAGYKYSFMTNSYPVTYGTNKFQIQRTNCEDSWSMALMKFQICGLIDNRFLKKRLRVEELTNV